MADIRLQVNGDSSGAQAAIVDAAKSLRTLADEAQRTGKTSADEVGKANAKWQEFANLAKLAAKSVLDFGVESVKAYAESERVSRQLQRAAGDLAGVFEKQAEALSKQLAVDDDVIKQQQTLLLQWGAAPSKIEGATKAILDYASATWKDAQSATMELMRSIDSGTGKLKSLGITYDVTGDKSKDLAAVTAALSKGLHDTAQTDANSLSGGARKAAQAFEDVKKAFGEFIVDVSQKSGALDYVTQSMMSWRSILGGDGGYNRLKQRGAVYDQLADAQKALADYEALSRDAQIAFDTNAAIEKTREYVNIDGTRQTPRSGSDLRTQIRELQEQRKKLDAPDPTLGNKPLNGSDITAEEKARRDALAKQAAADDEARKDREVKRLEDAHKEEKDYREFEDNQLAAQKKADAERLRALGKSMQEEEDERLKAYESARKVAKENDDLRLAEEAKAAEISNQQLKKEMNEKAAIIRQQQEAWRQAGDQLGAAMVNALSAQIENMAEGGEFDMGALLENVAIAAVSIAATAVGSYFGQPALGAAIGNLASMGIKYGAAEGRRKHHDGGWIEAERFHGGGWVGFDETPIIAQPGERMLSRAEVQRMGGGAAVDSMVAGGGGGRGGVTINVSGFDAKSTREFFQDRGGQGFRRAVQSGRGDLARMFGNGSLF